MNPTSKEIIDYLREAGFTVGVTRRPFIQNGQNWTRHTGQHDNRGVRFRWVKCDKKLIDAMGFKGCPTEEHVHLDVSIRTGAGGKHGEYGHLFIPQSLETLNEYRGAPPERHQIDRQNLPEPYQFRKDRFLISGNQYIRTGVIAKATLANVVGIQDNAKIDVEMAAKPDEPVWFHFDCEGYAGATFDIITDGEVWYPINRKSHRITNQMKPKKSVDLSNMSIVDQEFLVAAIADFATKM